MGSNQIVAVAEAIELALAVVEGDEVEMAQDFELEGAMKAFVLALGLRMLGANMGDPDPEPNQPQPQRGEGMLAVGTPRRAVVHQHLGGQAVAAEGGGQPAPFSQGAAVCRSRPMRSRRGRQLR